MRLLLATGGTGGHIYPAVAVAREILARGGEVAMLGQQDGMEERIAAEQGLPFFGVRAGKWDRTRPDPRQAFAAVAGISGAVRRTRNYAPDAVVGFGGFASFPGCFAAALSGIPLFLHEGNAFPGRVVRWFQGRARVVLAAQPEVATRLPRARRVETVGFPVREARYPSVDARRALGVPESGVLTLVMGGSQGSVALNELVPQAFELLPPGTRPFVLHATGTRWLDSVRERTPWDGYRCTGFVDAALAWSAADVAITRAGISTLAEAAFHGVPAIAVPLPTSAEDHQRFNAEAVASAGAGRHVDQTDLPGLVATWREMLDEGVRRRAAEAAFERSPVGAAAAVVDAIIAELNVAGTASGEDRA